MKNGFVYSWFVIGFGLSVFSYGLLKPSNRGTKTSN